MNVADTASPAAADTPKARRYNQIRRWLRVADFVHGLVFLVVLLVTGWTGALRDYAIQLAPDYYSVAVFLYVLMLLIISKFLGLGLDYYGFRLEHHYQLSNQKLRSWLWDEFKGWLLGLVLGTLLV
jgi:STE24 endopeptidase